MVYTTYLPGMSQSLTRFTMQIRKALFPPTECLSLFLALREGCLFFALCGSLPEIAGDVGLQVVVRCAAAVTANRARNGTRMVMRPAGTSRLSAGASAVGHIVISRAGAASDLIRSRRRLVGMRAVGVDRH